MCVMNRPSMPNPEPWKPTPPEEKDRKILMSGNAKSKSGGKKKKGIRKLQIPLSAGGAESGLGIPK